MTSSASSYTYRDNLSEWKNGVGFVNYTFNSYLASQQWTTEYYYGYSYRVPNGYAFNYSSTCNRIIFSIDVDEYSAKSEEKFVEEFERQLKNGGYTSVDNNFWKSSAGNYVSAGYNEGTIFVHYSFVEPTYSLKRIKRGKESEEVAEVAEEVAEVAEEVVEEGVEDS